MDHMLTMLEAAQRLNVGIDTVRKLIRTKRLKATRFGYRTVRISLKDLDAVVASKQKR